MSTSAADPAGDGAAAAPPREAAADAAARIGGTAADLRAVLAIAPFRRLFVGLTLSSLGDWLGLLAITAMAAALAGASYSAQGYAIAGVLFLRVLPAVVLGPLAGWVADRLDRRATMIVGDVLRAGLFASIAVVGTMWWLYAATVLVEAVSVVWMPVKDATVPNLVPPGQLEQANQVSLLATYGSALPAAGLFVLLTTAMRPLRDLAGIWVTSPVNLAIYTDAATYLVSAVAVAGIPQIGAAEGRVAGESVWRVIRDGWAFVVSTPLVRGLVFGIVGAFAAGGVVIGVGRIYVGDLGAGNPGYGVLFGAVFVGLAAGMWFGPWLLRGLSQRRLFGVALIAAGLFLLVAGLVQQIVIVTFVVLGVGFCGGVAWVVGYTMLGREVADALRGRTFAFVESLAKVALTVVLAAAPLVAGAIGRHDLHFGSGSGYRVSGAGVTIVAAAVIATVVGVVAYRQMDDRPGVPLLADLRRVVTGHVATMPATGLFVAFEGGEAVGKSTQVAALAAALDARGYAVTATLEPGGTLIGRRLRGLLLDVATGTLAPRTEALLYAADRAEHVDAVIRPALRRGEIVLSDRYVDSTLAYQGAGRALPDAAVERLCYWATGGLIPNLTVLLDAPVEQTLARVVAPDRLEQESRTFHDRVRSRFVALARAEPERYLVLDATAPREQLAAAVLARVEPLLARAAPSQPVAASPGPAGPAGPVAAAATDAVPGRKRG